MPKRADKARQYHYLYVEGHVLYLQGHHSQALPKLEEAVARNPEFFTGRLALAACYAQLGMLSEAEWELAEL